MKNKKKNKILENIRLLSAGAKGVSVGKTEEGKTVIVSGAVPGDLVNVRVKKSKSNYFEGEAIEILEYSEYRVEPKCIHFGTCGGCKWQNIAYEKQLDFKHSEVVNNIKRIGGVSDFETIPILGSKEQYFYRNKMEFSFSNSRWLTQYEISSEENFGNRDALGFHIPGMWSKILDLKECYLQEDPSNQIRLAVKKYAVENGLEFYDVKAQEGFLRTLMLRQNSKGDWMVLFQLYKEMESERIRLFDYLLSQFPQIKTLVFAINPKGNDSIYDLDIQTYFGEGYLFEEMDGLQFKISQIFFPDQL